MPLRVSVFVCLSVPLTHTNTLSTPSIATHTCRDNMHNGEHVEVQIFAPVAQPKTQTQTQTKSNPRPEVQALRTGTFTLKRKDVLCESRYVR